MRRVVVEIVKGDDTLNCGGVKLHINPKVRKMLLQFLIVEIDIKAIESQYQNLLSEAFGDLPAKYSFNLYDDICYFENDLDLQLKQTIRNLILFDMLYKMKQEKEKIEKTGF